MQFQLIQVDTYPGYNGLAELRNIVAVSHDSEKLNEYCQDTYGYKVGKPLTCTFDQYYYLIEETDIKII